jgi:hypothetical protein
MCHAQRSLRDGKKNWVGPSTICYNKNAVFSEGVIGVEQHEVPDRSHYPTRLLRAGDPEAGNDDLSATTTAAERLGMVEVLTRRCWALMGHPIDGTRLQRHVGRIIRRKG